jgi:hypothetical protein
MVKRRTKLYKMNSKQLAFQHSEIDVTVNQRFKLMDGTEAVMNVKPIFAFAGGVKDEPIGLTIVPSGWPGQFHVIVEFGDSDDFDTYFLNREQILARFGVEVPDLNLRDLTRKEGNDMSLGREIRTTQI